MTDEHDSDASYAAVGDYIRTAVLPANSASLQTRSLPEVTGHEEGS